MTTTAAKGDQPSNFYQALGVDRGASAAQIRDAYRSLAKRHHPDVAQPSDAHKRNEQAFAAIARAYEVLSDPAQRATYDEQLDANERLSASSAGRAHYSWQNIAAPGGGTTGRPGRPAKKPTGDEKGSKTGAASAPGTRGTEFDDLYDTFFGPGTKG